MVGRKRVRENDEVRDTYQYIETILLIQYKYR